MRTIKLRINSYFDKLSKRDKTKILKRYHLSYNNWIGLYRNERADVKIGFELKVQEELSKVEGIEDMFFKRAKISYEVYLKSKAGADIMNLVSIIDKMALDAVVRFGLLEDDEYLFVDSYGSIKFMGYDEEKLGYVIMIIEEMPEKEELEIEKEKKRKRKEKAEKAKLKKKDK